MDAQASDVDVRLSLVSEEETPKQALDATLPPATPRMDDTTIHVRGVGGALEDETALCDVFRHFGDVSHATVRKRTAPDGANTSWALVVMESPAGAAAAVAGVAAGQLQPNYPALRATHYSPKQAAASTGRMGGLFRSNTKKVIRLNHMNSHLESIEAEATAYLGLKRTYTAVELSPRTAADQSSTNDPKSDINAASRDQARRPSLDLAATMEDSERELAAAKARPLFLTPNSKARTTWDLYVLGLLLYVSFIIPLRMGFSIEPKPWQFDFLLEIIVDVSFVSDIVLNFRTGYYDEAGHLISQPRHVAQACEWRFSCLFRVVGCLY